MLLKVCFPPNVQITNFDEIIQKVIDIDTSDGWHLENEIEMYYMVSHLPSAPLTAAEPERDSLWTCYWCHYSSKCYKIQLQVQMAFRPFPHNPLFFLLGKYTSPSCFLRGIPKYLRKSAAVKYQLVLNSATQLCSHSYSTVCTYLDFFV